MAQADTATLDARRAAVEDKLAALRMTPAEDVAEALRRADIAVSGFKSEVASYEAQLAEIDGQLQLRERDRRAAAAKEREQKWLADRQALLDEEDLRLQAISDAEKATRALVDALNRALAANARMVKLAQALSPSGKVPTALSPLDLVTRLGNRVASVMSTVVGHRARLGPLQWPGGAIGHPANRSWRDDEEKRVAAGLQPLLEKGRT